MNYARAMLLGKKEQREDIPCTQCDWYKEMKKSMTLVVFPKRTLKCRGYFMIIDAAELKRRYLQRIAGVRDKTSLHRA